MNKIKFSFLDKNDARYFRNGSATARELLNLKIQVKRLEVLRQLGSGREIIGIGEKAVHGFAGEKMPSIFSVIYYFLSEGYLILSDYAKMAEAANKAIELYEKSGDRKGQAICLDNLGVVFEDTGQAEKALEHYARALAIQEQINDEIGQTESLLNMGTCLTGLNDFERAFECFRKAIAIGERTGDKRNLGYAYGNYSILLRKMKRWPETREYIELSLKVRRETGDKYGEAFSLSLLASDIMREGQWRFAARYLEDCIRIREQLGEKMFATYNYLEYGTMLGRLGKYRDAVVLLRKAARNAAELGIRSDLHDANMELAVIFFAQGKLIDAEHYLNEADGCAVDDHGTFRAACYMAELAILQGRTANAHEIRRGIENQIKLMPIDLRNLYFRISAKYGIATNQNRETIECDFEEAVMCARNYFVQDRFPLALTLYEFCGWLKAVNRPYQERLSEVIAILRDFGAENWLRRIESEFDLKIRP